MINFINHHSIINEKVQRDIIPKSLEQEQLKVIAATKAGKEDEQLVGMQSDKIFFENYFCHPFILNLFHVLWSNNSTTRYLHKRSRNICL